MKYDPYTAMGTSAANFAPSQLYEDLGKPEFPDLFRPKRKREGLMQELTRRLKRDAAGMVSISELFDGFLREYETAVREGAEDRIVEISKEMFGIARRVLDKAWNGWLLLVCIRRLRAAGFKTSADFVTNTMVKAAVDEWYNAKLREHVIDPESMNRELAEERKTLQRHFKGKENDSLLEQTRIFERYFDEVAPILHRLAKEVRPKLRNAEHWHQLDKNVLDLLQYLKEDAEVREYHKRRKERRSRVGSQ